MHGGHISVRRLGRQRMVTASRTLLSNVELPDEASEQLMRWPADYKTDRRWLLRFMNQKLSVLVAALAPSGHPLVDFLSLARTWPTLDPPIRHALLILARLNPARAFASTSHTTTLEAPRCANSRPAESRM